MENSGSRIKYDVDRIHSDPFIALCLDLSYKKKERNDCNVKPKKADPSLKTESGIYYSQKEWSKKFEEKG